MNKERNIDQFITSLFSTLPLSDDVLKGFLASPTKYPVPEAVRERLLDKLQRVHQKTIERSDKLKNPKKNVTLGEFVNNLRQKKELDLYAAALEIDVPRDILEKIEQNIMAMSKVPLKQMIALIQWSRINIEDAFTLIRKSQSLFRLRNEFGGISARYDSKGEAAVRESSMISAYHELKLKGRKSRESADREIESYLLHLKRVLGDE